MLNRTLRNVMSLSFMAVLALVMVGCKSSPSMQRHDVTVALADDVSAGSDTYTVYLVGVGADEQFSKMQATGVDDFIRQEDLRRVYPTTTFTLNKDNSAPKTLAATSPMWDDWQKAGVMNLFVVADLPDAPADRSAAGDTRRVIIPLSSDRWNGTEKLKVTLRRSAISYAPGPQPVK